MTPIMRELLVGMESKLKREQTTSSFIVSEDYVINSLGVLNPDKCYRVTVRCRGALPYILPQLERFVTMRRTEESTDWNRLLETPQRRVNGKTVKTSTITLEFLEGEEP